MPPRVLFVDDEPMILNALRRAFRADPDRWEIAFATSGEGALQEFARTPFDIVVTDMRMPGMDGGELLERIKAVSPQTLRLVMSGQSSFESVMRLLPVAHQFLTKPFEVEGLRNVMLRLAELQALLAQPALRRVVGAMASLPPATHSYREVTRLASSASAGARDIAAVVGRDPALSAKVLQLVNSAFFSPTERIVSVQQAVVTLGVGMVRVLALSAQVFGALPSGPGVAALVDGFQLRSLQVAGLAQRLIDDPLHAEEALMGGLLHNVGALILALEFPQEVKQVDGLVGPGRSRSSAELEVFGTSHAEVGAYLLGAWGLPWSLVEMAAFHHRPRAGAGVAQALMAAVHVGDGLLDGTGEAEIDLPFLEEAGLVPMLARGRALVAEVRGQAASSGVEPGP